jgi:CHRD domain
MSEENVELVRENGRITNSESGYPLSEIEPGIVPEIGGGMRSGLTVLIAALAATLAFAGVALAGNGGRPLSTPMSGAEEAPGPGDANATGQADLRLNQGKKRICFELSWEDIDGTVVAAHIHEAPPGEPGPIVVPLFEGTFAGTDEVSDCVDVDKSLIKDIRKHPDDYYVNVHSTPGFEAGAVRGQLEKK